ncbi:MAG: SDR family NAD(P)-dependent oxidoreductase [Pseudomonadota bacterium]
MADQIAIVLGVGAERGLGGALCRRAAADGYHVIVSGRTEEKLAAVADSITTAGGRASTMVADVTQPDQVAALFSATDAMGGELGFVGYNAGNAFVHDPMNMPADFFEDAWRVCCLGGFLTGQEAGRRMAAQGKGSILFTGATASVKARPRFMAFASAKAGLRSVAAALARELGPQGVHVAHAIIDGGIDGERLTSRRPDAKEKMGENGLLDPDAIAESYWQVHLQHPSAWSFEIDLRPFKETF